MTRTTIFLFLGLFIPWQTVIAGGDSWSENLHLLPPYCKERAKGITHPNAPSLHYYCKALLYEVRARTAVDQHTRNRLLQETTDKMKAWENYCKTGCVLYPDLHTRLGRILGEQGQFADAIKHFQLAFQQKRDYTPAYAGMSDLYVELDQPDEARKVLEAGLKARPNSRSLKKRLEELGSSK